MTPSVVVVVGPAGGAGAAARSSDNGVGGGDDENGDGGCLLCYSPKVNNNNSLELLEPLDPKYGAKVNANAWAVFVLRKLFRFTADEVENVLVRRGGEVEPAQWFLICDECVDWLGEFRGAVKEAKKGVPGAEEKVKSMRREVKEKLRLGLAGGGGDGDRRRSQEEVTDLLVFLEREVEEEEEGEVVQPEDDEDEGYDDDDSETDHSSVSTGSSSTSSHSSRIIEEALASSSARNGASASANNKDSEAHPPLPNLQIQQPCSTGEVPPAAPVQSPSSASLLAQKWFQTEAPGWSFRSHQQSVQTDAPPESHHQAQTSVQTDSPLPASLQHQTETNNNNNNLPFPNLLRLQQVLTLLAEAAAVVEKLSPAQAEAGVAVPLPPPPPPPAPLQNPIISAQLDGSSTSAQVQKKHVQPRDDDDAPEEEEDGVEVPLWRINVVEGYHESGEERPILLDDDMSDEAFMERHQTCEAEEKRTRRCGSRKMTGKCYVEGPKQKQEDHRERQNEIKIHPRRKRRSGSCTSSSDVVPQESEPVVSPRLVDVEAIHVGKELPVDAFEVL